jgi:hypothetical protein
MKFVIYSDKNYEYQVQNFLHSYDYAKLDNEIIYFTIGFNSELTHKNLIKITHPIDKNLPNLILYTPKICLEALSLFDDNFCYVDTDIILSKRFKNFNLDFSTDFPVCCKAPVEYPYIYSINENGETKIKDETKLMNYFNIKERTMFYVLACFFTFNKNSEDFLHEWKSICENQYLLKDIEHNMPFSDETALNVLLWKRGITKNYGHKFMNTHKFSTFIMCENGERILNTYIDDNFYEFCEDSNEIFFYHGYKDNDVVKDFGLKI